MGNTLANSSDDKAVIRSVLNRLQKALSDALMLVVAEQEHHALSYRSMMMMEHYAQILPSFYKPHLEGFDNELKQGLGRWLEWVKITLESALHEESRDFNTVKRRAIIVLADIFEGVVESAVVTCLRHLARDQTPLRKLTGYRGKGDTEKELKFAFRTWEKRLYGSMPSRAQRFGRMISAFFPKFLIPATAGRLDDLVERRNRYTHEIIIVTDDLSDIVTLPTASAQEIDDFFAAVGDFIIAMLGAIPGNLVGPLPVFDLKYGAEEKLSHAPRVPS